VFYFNLLLALLIIVLTLWKLKGEWTGASNRFDGVGVFLCITAQALLLFGLTDLTAGFFYQASFGIGVLLLVTFFLYEKNRSNPLLPIGSIVKNRTFAFSNLAALINYSATFALSYVLSLYLQAALGLDTATSGLILLVQPIFMAALSPVAGMLSDRIRPAILASVGMGISAAGLLFFIFLSVETSVVLIIINLAFIGLGYALFASPNTNAVMGSVDQSLYGVGSSILGNMRLLGQSISIAIMSLIMSVVMPGLMIDSPGYVGQLMISLRIGFIIFTVLCILGVFASLARDRGKKPEETQR
jgi:predicted MFS family arabinose efflux permease